MVLYKIISLLTRKDFQNFRRHISHTRNMAKSLFEYVKDFELDDRLLPNTWLVVRLDGKCFHRFADKHEFTKPNDERALRLMNRAAVTVLEDFPDVLLAYGQSDEYSFILKKSTEWYNRRCAKILTTVNSKFTAAYVFYWSEYFRNVTLKYPPSFDGRIVAYPTEKNLVDYLKWRQADVHVNNLYNTTFWNLVLRGNMTPQEAEQKLCGTVSADKNEILFSQFSMNYNNEPTIYKRGTILLRRHVRDEASNKLRAIIVDVHDDMLKENFWDEHPDIFASDISKYEGPMSDLIALQLAKKNSRKSKAEEIIET